MKYNIIQTKSGHKTLEIITGGKNFFLNDLDNPVKKAEQEVEQFFSYQNKTKYIVIIGSDFFYLVDAIIKNHEIFERLEYIFIIDAWKDLVDISLKESPNADCLNNKKIKLMFDFSIGDINKSFLDLKIDVSGLGVLLSKGSGVNYYKNKRFFEFLKEKFLIKIPDDLYQEYLSIITQPENKTLNDYTATILLMCGIIQRYERRDLNYDLV